jgi:hypothetical protein
MREFECPDEGITVGRGVVDAFVAAFGLYKAGGERVVCRHLGIDGLGGMGDAHFPVRRFFGAMAELQGHFGGGFMHKVGSFVFDSAVFPPGIDSIERAMALIHAAYHLNHSANAAGRIGGYHWRATDTRSGRMICDNPYPCAFDLGIIETIARRFVPEAKVVHEPGSCRHDGGGSCTYGVGW